MTGLEHELRKEERWARVEPGLVQDELNHHGRPLGLLFGPDTSTSNRATLGGMMGNNEVARIREAYGDEIRARYPAYWEQGNIKALVRKGRRHRRGPRRPPPRPPPPIARAKPALEPVFIVRHALLPSNQRLAAR